MNKKIVLLVGLTILVYGHKSLPLGSPGPRGCLLPLCAAIYDNDIKQLQALLEQGISPNDHNVNPGCNCPNDFALHEAVIKGNLEMVKLLIAAKADVNREYEFHAGYTENGTFYQKLRPLHLAKKPEIIQALKNAGATDAPPSEKRFEPKETK
jgi:ankyrin repeat protein